MLTILSSVEQPTKFELVYTGTVPALRVTKDGAGRATLYLNGKALAEGDAFEAIFQELKKLAFA